MNPDVPPDAPQNAQQGTPPEEFILGPVADPNSPSELFYSRAIRRVRGFTIALALSALLFTGAVFGTRALAGLLLGAALGYWNFHSLVGAVNTLAGRIVEQHEVTRGGAMVFRFIARIPLVALAGYAIFISSPGSLKGFLAGLCVPIAAIFCEAAYEAYAALRRGF